MYELILNHIEYYNNKIIQNHIDIKNIIEDIKKIPTNAKFEKFCFLKDNQCKYLYNVLKDIKNEGFKTYEIIFRINLNNCVLYDIKIIYNKKSIYLKAKCIKNILEKVYELINDINIIKKNSIIQIYYEKKDELNYVEKLNMSYEDNEENIYFKELISQLELFTKIKIIGVFYDPLRNLYIPFGINIL